MPGLPAAHRRAGRHLRAVLLALAGAATTCRCVGTSADGRGRRGAYPWSMARGPVGGHGASPDVAPHDLQSSLSWTYPPAGASSKFTNPGGIVLIDDDMNIYANMDSHLTKFSPDGQPLWVQREVSTHAPTLMDGLVYGNTQSGGAFALEMGSGRERWRTKFCNVAPPIYEQARVGGGGWLGEWYYCNFVGPDAAQVSAHNGVVVTASYGAVYGGNLQLIGLNATTGDFLWEYVPDNLMWNVNPVFTDNGTSVVFQDVVGGVYHLGIDGKLLWKTGFTEAWRETFSTGGVTVGPNGVVYSTKCFGPGAAAPPFAENSPGQLLAHRLSDGQLLWKSPLFDDPADSWPLVGRLGEGRELLVMVAAGQAAVWVHIELHTVGMPGGGLMNWRISTFLRYAPSSAVYLLHQLSLALEEGSQLLWHNRHYANQLWALGADDGRVRWKYSFPVWKRSSARGDEERYMEINRRACRPGPVSTPTLDGSGHIYIGNVDGIMYVLADHDGDDVVEVVSTYESQNAFGVSGAAVAPGVLGVNNCGTLLVFKDKST